MLTFCFFFICYVRTYFPFEDDQAHFFILEFDLFMTFPCVDDHVHFISEFVLFMTFIHVLFSRQSMSGDRAPDPCELQ